MIARRAVIVRVVIFGIDVRLHHRGDDLPIPTTEIDQSAARQHPLGNESEEKRDGEYGGHGPH